MHYTLRFSIVVTARDQRGAPAQWSILDRVSNTTSKEQHVTMEAAKAHYLKIMEWGRRQAVKGFASPPAAKDATSAAA